MTKTCANKKCLELVPSGEGWALCPACRYIGRFCFWLGALLAGVLGQVIPLWWRWYTSN